MMTTNTQKRANHMRRSRIEQALSSKTPQAQGRWQADAEENVVQADVLATEPPHSQVKGAQTAPGAHRPMPTPSSTRTTRVTPEMEDEDDDEPERIVFEDEDEQEEERAFAAAPTERLPEPTPLLMPAYQVVTRQTRSSRTVPTDQQPRRTMSGPRTTEWPHTQRPMTGPRRLTRQRPMVSLPDSSLFQHVSERFQQHHWATMLACGMAMTLGLILLFGAGSMAWTSLHNQVTYGTPRTMQLDTVIEDHDSAMHPSHLIALNLHGQVEVFVLPGGDPAHAQVLLGPNLPWTNADQATVTVETRDVNHDGKLDLVVQITGAPQLFGAPPTMELVAYNTGTGFKPFVQLQGH